MPHRSLLPLHFLFTSSLLPLHFLFTYSSLPLHLLPGWCGPLYFLFTYSSLPLHFLFTYCQVGVVGSDDNALDDFSTQSSRAGMTSQAGTRWVGLRVPLFLAGGSLTIDVDSTSYRTMKFISQPTLGTRMVSMAEDKTRSESKKTQRNAFGTFTGYR